VLYTARMEIHPAIVENIRKKETVVFIGSGFSRLAGFPSAQAIASYLSRKLAVDGKRVDFKIADNFDQVAQLFSVTYGRARLIAEMEALLRTSPQDEISPSHRLLASLVKHGFVKTIVTTNYDTLIEDACAQSGAPISVVAHEAQLHAAAGDTPVLWKIHGDFAHPELLVLTDYDLHRWSRPETRPIVTQLQTLFDRNALLFFGYSLSDFNILSQLLNADFATRGAPHHKRFAALYSKSEAEDEAERLRQYSVEAFHCDNVEELLRSLLLRLPIKLNIRHLVFNYPSWYPDQQARYGGIETFIAYLRKFADGIEHRVETVYTGKTLSYSPIHTAYTASPIYPASYFYFKAVTKAALEQLLVECRAGSESVPDVVHIHFLAFAPMCEQTGIATLCTSHSLLSVDLAYAKGVFDDLASERGKHEVIGVYEAEKLAASASRFVSVVSSAHEQEVRALGARSVRCLAAPFDPFQFTPEPTPQRARQEARLADRFTITYVGRPDRRKGIEILLRACENLAETVPNLQLVIVGYGFSYSQGQLGFGSKSYHFDVSRLEARGVKIQLSSAFDSAGAGVFYTASDIVVVPSLYEPMGYVAMEAMACSRPVVAAHVGGLAEIITDGRNGLLFEAGNYEQLTEKLVALSNDAGLRERLGRQARQDIEQRRPAAEVVLDWQMLYRQTAFAFGESLYPDNDLLGLIRKKCEQMALDNTGLRIGDVGARFSNQGHVDLFGVALLGCHVAKEIIAENAGKCALPDGVPVDRALVRAIALEMLRALRQKGAAVSFSASDLTEIIIDLSLAVVNRDPGPVQSHCISAEETRRRMAASWFQNAIAFK